MGFLEIQLPPEVSYGTQGGPSFNNQILSNPDSWADEVVQRSPNPRHKYDLSYGVNSYELFASVKRHYYVVGASANGWRYKDWLDYTTNNVNNTSAYNHQDQTIGTGDGVKTVFQLTKSYTFGGFTYVRAIKKPVVGKVSVALGVTLQTSGFSVNYTTGEVTFTTPPTNGTLVKWGGEFDVPCRYDGSADEWLAISADSFDSGEIPSINVIETVDPNGDLELLPRMGGTRWANAAPFNNTNQQISIGFGFAQGHHPAVSGLKMFLPDAANLPLGGPYFHLANFGTFSYDLRGPNDSAIITVPTSSSVIVSLLLDIAGNKAWFAK